MTLDDFERSLAESRSVREKHDNPDSHESKRKRHKHHHFDHHRHHYEEDEKDRRRHRHRHRHRHSKRSRHHEPQTFDEDSGAVSVSQSPRDESEASKDPADIEGRADGQGPKIKRDSWMEEPSGIDVVYTQKTNQNVPASTVSRFLGSTAQYIMPDSEPNTGNLQENGVRGSGSHDVDYVFGDVGAKWRMMKLKGVYRRAEESGRPIEDVAIEQYGNLREFDYAREEQTEIDRRETYGEGYARKEKPNGELSLEREHETKAQNERSSSTKELGVKVDDPSQAVESTIPSSSQSQFDQSGLNRLRAQMMKAKLKGSVDAEKLQAEYEKAVKSSTVNLDPETVVLGAMDNRMLTGGRRSEVKAIDNKRGKERGLVEENEDMTIEDMVREERRNKNHPGGEGLRYAERIAKDGKFDNDLDYMEENANKLAKRVHKSEINLRSSAISDFQKMNRILDKCPLCYHEDSNRPPIAPVVSLATRTYLTLPTEPEISEGGACIIPLQHRRNLLECDDDEWEEIRNFMKSLIRMYHDQERAVIFYENAATPQKMRHAGMEVVPLPYSLSEVAPAFFKEAILVSDEEWTQHKKIIDTLAKAKQGLGRLAFRRTLAKEMPYFHVWFELDGGMGHIVEDANRWPKGDIFAREIVGGMLDKAPDVIKRQGRWSSEDSGRTEAFHKRWRKFDWTRVLTDT
ncbi:MAG: hypothetical protein Q9214_004115 [Letrouitia sp. 1 TL-2023]